MKRTLNNDRKDPGTAAAPPVTPWYDESERTADREPKTIEAVWHPYPFAALLPPPIFGIRHYIANKPTNCATPTTSRPND